MTFLVVPPKDGFALQSMTNTFMSKFVNSQLLKKLLPRFHYNTNHRKGAPKKLGQWVPKSNMEPSPKRGHANTLDDVFIMVMSQGEPKFANQMTKETQLIN